MSFLRTIWINLGIYSTTLMWTVIATVLSPAAYLLLKTARGYSSEETVRRLVWVYGRGWVLLTSLFVPITRAKDELPSPCILVLNHASFFDTYLIGAQQTHNICLTIRDWPYKIPFYRPFMNAANYVRTENTEPGQTVEESVRALKNGSTVAFFPEGTRTRTGKLSRFHSGAFYTALQANVPVVPMCIHGSYHLLPPGNKLLRYSPITVSLLPPVYPDRYQDMTNGHVQMRKDVKALMTSALEKMADDSR